MFEFLNPGFLAAGGALVSSPIIIHLINRLRYKRIHWAAMEFLLKSQKKNRRRLIIEQMILLFLRCLLVVLALLLVARLLKISFGVFGEISIGQSTKLKSVHVVLLDDSVSMSDWVDDPRRPHCVNCFEVAKEVISNEITKNAGVSTTPQDLYLVTLSELAVNPKFKPVVYERLADDSTKEKIKKDLSRLKCSALHLPLLKGVNLAQKIADDHKDDQVVVHILSDFRRRDWTVGEGKTLSTAVIQLASSKAKVNLIDTAHPYRPQSREAPQRHENIGITEFYPETRVVASDAYVRFWLTIHNYGSTVKEVRIALFDPESGRPLQEFEDGVHHKIAPGKDYRTKIDPRFHREADQGEGFAQISAKLEIVEGDRESTDGLASDNVRHAAVFVRPKIPVLIIDGEPKRRNVDGSDTLHVAAALDAAPGAGYEIQPELTKDEGGTVRDLEQGNLDKYPSIFMLNVPSLESKEQLKNLEDYVKNGGSVAFFLGPLVDAQYYNNALYNKGKGLFPVELLDQYYPPQGRPPLQPNLDDNHYKVLLRDDLFPISSQYPVFGPVHDNEIMRDSFKYLPIYRYFPIRDINNWDAKAAGVEELATMPNLEPVSNYANAAKNIRDQLGKLSEEKKYDRYSLVLNDYRKQINKALERDRKGNPKDCYELADVLQKLLTDRGSEDPMAQPQPGDRRGRRRIGDERPNLIKFWDMGDNEGLKNEIISLGKKVRYGHPLVVTKRFGRGRVIAVMTTAGKGGIRDEERWSGWLAQPSYVPMILEMQSYMSSLGSEANLTVGESLTLYMGKGQFESKVKRTYFMPFLEQLIETSKTRPAGQTGKPVVGQNQKADVFPTDYTADKDLKTGNQVLRVHNFYQPGFYRFDLTIPAKKDEKAKPVVEQRGYAFNVDTQREGDLQRISREMLLETSLQGAPTENIKMHGPFGWGVTLVDRQTDFSEWAWFYLIFMMILVAEQALAVHLSFHLRDNEAALPAQAVRSQAMT